MRSGIGSTLAIAFLLSVGGTGARAGDGGHWGHERSESHRHGAFGHDRFFFHHHNRFFRSFVVINPFFYPYAYYPYATYGAPGVIYAPPPSYVMLSDPVPGWPENCREFQNMLMIDGQWQPAFGKACQQPDGSWQIVP